MKNGSDKFAVCILFDIDIAFVFLLSMPIMDELCLLRPFVSNRIALKNYDLCLAAKNLGLSLAFTHFLCIFAADNHILNDYEDYSIMHCFPVSVLRYASGREYSV